LINFKLSGIVNETQGD